MPEVQGWPSASFAGVYGSAGPGITGSLHEKVYKNDTPFEANASTNVKRSA
jgi:hypothetical protein